MYEEITPLSEKAEILKDVKEKGISTDLGSFADLIASPAAYRMWNLYQALNIFAEIMTMDTSEGEFVIKKCRDYGIEQKEATESNGILTFRGEDGATVPMGTYCKTSDGRRYYTLSDAEIEGGICYVEAQSEGAGKFYNADVGEIKFFDEQPDKITSVTNESAFEGGTDIERIESMKERYFQKVRYSPASGNVEDYRKWAMEIPEVYGARVIPLYEGAGTVGVILVGEDNTLVEEGAVNRTREYIESVRPIGAQVTVKSCTAAEISVNATVRLRYEATLSDIKATSEKSIKEYFGSFEGERVYLSKIIQLIMDTGGIWSCENVLLNGAEEDVSITIEQVPYLLSFSIEAVSE